VLLASAILFLWAPGSPLRTALPPESIDRYPAAAWIELEAASLPPDFVRLTGEVIVRRGAPTPGIPGTTTIETEIVALSLTGTSGVYGGVTVTLNPGVASQGIVQTLGSGDDAPLESFFDIFVDIRLSGLDLATFTRDPFRIHAIVSSIPWREVHVPSLPQRIPLLEVESGVPVGSLGHLAVDFNPRVDCLTAAATMEWTFLQRREIVALDGPSIVVSSDPLDPTDNLPEFNTEMVQMDLVGTSALLGPIGIVERPETISPGRTKSNVGGASFPAGSFFDVFVTVSEGGTAILFNLDPLGMMSTVTAWPPLGSPYLLSGPTDLLNPAGERIAIVESLELTFTEVTECCADEDGDGVFAPPCGDDCDDGDPTNFPGNIEACDDGRDNDCNQEPDCRDPSCLNRPCDDQNSCTLDDVCVEGGQCVGDPNDCDDQNVCTDDRCDPQSGQCLHEPLIGQACEDGDLCTVKDICVEDPTGNVSCEGIPVICDDGDQCTRDLCDPSTGLCQFLPDPGAPCDDGDLCTENDRCVQEPTGAIFCQGAPVGCDDSNLCTIDFCDPDSGECVYQPIICDDGNVCTADACNPDTGQCEYLPIPMLEVEVVRFHNAVTLEWSSTPDATHWNTYRGTIPSGLMGSRPPGSQYDHRCFESDDSAGDGATIATDKDTPPRGTAFYYDITGEGQCGEGPLGSDSSGTVRPNIAPCPTPP
jgi:hypothetical protein